MYGTSCRQPFFFLFFDDGGALLHADDALSGVGAALHDVIDDESANGASAEAYVSDANGHVLEIDHKQPQPDIQYQIQATEQAKKRKIIYFFS